MNQKFHRKWLALLTGIVMMLPAYGCGGGSQQGGIDLSQHKNTYSIPFQTDAAASNAVLIQPGYVSCYQEKSEEKPKVQIWYDNADSSTNVCSDIGEINNGATAAGLDLSLKYIKEFYNRLLNTSLNFSGAECTDLYTLTGNAAVNLIDASANSVTWNTVPHVSTDASPTDAAFYVRSLQMQDFDSPEYVELTDNYYQVLGEGALRQLYKDGGRISDDSFAKDINVVFSDLADADLSNTALAEMIVKRLDTARAADNDVSIFCLGVKLPYTGWIAVPDRTNSLQQMKLYRQTYVNQETGRSYYLIISGPTEITRAYANSLKNGLSEKIIADPDNTDGYKVESMFTNLQLEEETTTEEDLTGAEDVIQLIIPEDAQAKKKPTPKQQQGTTETTEATTTDTTAETTVTTAADDDNHFETQHFMAVPKEELFTLYNGQDVSALTEYAEKNQFRWKKFMNGVKITSQGAVGYPAGLNAKVRSDANVQIVGSKLYQASLTADGACNWVNVSNSDFANYGTLTTLKEQVYLEFTKKQAPVDTFTWLLEFDLANGSGADYTQFLDSAFTESYSTADLSDSSYFCAMNMNEFAETILSAEDTQIKQKYYVLITLKDTPTTASKAPARQSAPAQ